MGIKTELLKKRLLFNPILLVGIKLKLRRSGHRNLVVADFRIVLSQFRFHVFRPNQILVCTQRHSCLGQIVPRINHGRSRDAQICSSRKNRRHFEPALVRTKNFGRRHFAQNRLDRTVKRILPDCFLVFFFKRKNLVVVADAFGRPFDHFVENPFGCGVLLPIPIGQKRGVARNPCVVVQSREANQFAQVFFLDAFAVIGNNDIIADRPEIA